MICLNSKKAVNNNRFYIAGDDCNTETIYRNLYPTFTSLAVPSWSDLCSDILVNKRNDTKIFLKYICMLKPEQLFIIIYVNVFVKRVYPHKTNNNILFRYGKIPESQFSFPWSN